MKQPEVIETSELTKFKVELEVPKSTKIIYETYYAKNLTELYNMIRKDYPKNKIYAIIG